MSIEERNKLVEENLNLVYAVLHSLGVGNNEDYFQEGCIHLMRCAENFDASKGFKFSTYAYKNIKYAIIEYMKTDGLVKSYRTGGVRQYPTVYSIDEENGSGGDYDSTWKDCIEDYSSLDYKERLYLDSYLDQLIKEKSIDNIQKEIILLKCDGYTDKEIGEILDKSQSWINIKKLDAFEMLRALIEKESYI